MEMILRSKLEVLIQLGKVDVKSSYVVSTNGNIKL